MSFQPFLLLDSQAEVEGPMVTHGEAITNVEADVLHLGITAAFDLLQEVGVVVDVVAGVAKRHTKRIGRRLAAAQDAASALVGSPVPSVPAPSQP